jgi:hypothetical protein
LSNALLAHDEVDDLIKTRLVAVVGRDLQYRDVEVRSPLVDRRVHTRDRPGRAVLDTGLAECVEYGSSVQRRIVRLAMGEPLHGVPTRRQQHHAVCR